MKRKKINLVKQVHPIHTIRADGEVYKMWALQGLISQTFYEHLLRMQIPEAQKYSQAISLFVLSGSVCVKVLLVKCWWNWPLNSNEERTRKLMLRVTSPVYIFSRQSVRKKFKLKSFSWTLYYPIYNKFVTIVTHYWLQCRNKVRIIGHKWLT